MDIFDIRDLMNGYIRANQIVPSEAMIEEHGYINIINDPSLILSLYKDKYTDTIDSLNAYINASNTELYLDVSETDYQAYVGIRAINPDKGYVEKYPCDCSGGNYCWIVRHPLVDPPVSFPSKSKAEKYLAKQRGE